MPTAAGLPALRLHAEHLELNGQNGLCIDVGIHARAISLVLLIVSRSRRSTMRSG
jgi:hypothetical protein